MAGVNYIVVSRNASGVLRYARKLQDRGIAVAWTEDYLAATRMTYTDATRIAEKNKSRNAFVANQNQNKVVMVKAGRSKLLFAKRDPKNDSVVFTPTEADAGLFNMSEAYDISNLMGDWGVSVEEVG